MNDWSSQKPSIEEWFSWAAIIIDRLTDCVHVYKKPPHGDVFIPDADRQSQTDATVKLLHRIHMLADQTETPTDSIPDVHNNDERLVDGLAVTFRETLAALPRLSADMQKLLKSPWQSKFPSKPAQRIFLGDGDQAHGIGSGYVEHGRLPEALFTMLEREKIGDTRHPRAELLQQGEPRRHDIGARKRWSVAGRVE